MKFQSFLIKYGEIALKGSNRHIFEDALLSKIKYALKHADGEFEVTKSVGRMYVEGLTDFDSDEVVGLLQKVFGITKICPVIRVPDDGFENLKGYVLDYVKNAHPELNFTFKVDCRRTRKNYPLDSQEMNALLGEVILDTYPNVRVDVHHPDVLLRVEVREHFINIYSQEIDGAYGMPVGTAGKAMLLLSGGIDSPVAGWMTAKRGVNIDAVYFHAPPYTSERAKQKVVDLAKIIARYTGKIHLHVINFTDIQMAIYEKCPHDELTVIMRRYMMKIAQKLAEDSGCQALVTGESIGQVASQTMPALCCTNAVCTMPVFRPLIAFDKQDIVDISLKIDTYETSILPYEDCCTIFVAKHPVTHPRLDVIEKSERKLDDVIEPLMAAAFESDEVIVCEQY